MPCTAMALKLSVAWDMSSLTTDIQRVTFDLRRSAVNPYLSRMKTMANPIGMWLHAIYLTST
jgi:hypothetical protein